MPQTKAGTSELKEQAGLRHLIIFVAALSVFAPSAHATVRLRVCNDGSIPVYAAVVSESGLIHPLKFHGWNKIETGNRNAFNSCWPFFIGGINVNWYYILFGIYDKDDRFGVVVYKFKERNATVGEYVCVPAPGKEQSDCKKVPVSSGFRPKDFREIDYHYDVKPDIGDQIAVYLDPPRTAQTTVPAVELPSGVRLIKSGDGLPTGIYTCLDNRPSQDAAIRDAERLITVGYLKPYVIGPTRDWQNRQVWFALIGPLSDSASGKAFDKLAALGYNPSNIFFRGD